jgi:hypothetical protein
MRGNLSFTLTSFLSRRRLCRNVILRRSRRISPLQPIDRPRFFTGVQNDISGNFVIATQSLEGEEVKRKYGTKLSLGSLDHFAPSLLNLHGPTFIGP